MKDRKGFTLVELIAVVVVLGIIALIAVPAVSNYMYKADDEYYVAVSNSVLASGRDYFSDYHTLLPKNDNDTTSVELEELVEDDYIDKIVNNDGEECTGTVYVTRKGNRDYTYCVVIYCGEEKKLRKNTCGNGDEVPEVKDREYKILKQVSLRIPQCSTYEELINGIPSTQYVGAEAKYKYNNKLIGLLADKNENVLQNNGRNIIIYPDESDLNLKALGDYSLTYEYNGADNQVTKVTVEDKVAPQGVRVDFRIGDKNGDPYTCNNETQCTWKNQQVVLVFSGEDKSSCGTEGSGIDYFYYKLEGETEKRITAYRNGNGKYIGYDVINKSYKGTITIRATDRSGNNISGTGRYLMIDLVNPTCVSSGGSTNWTSEDVTLTGTCSDNLSGCVNGTITKKYTDSYVESSTETPGTVYDNAGNSVVCPNNQTVKIDKTPPVAETTGHSDGNPASWSVKCSDPQSGVVNSSLSLSINSVGKKTLTCVNGSGLEAPISHTFGSSNCATGEPNHCVPGCDGTSKLKGSCSSWSPNSNCDTSCAAHGGTPTCESCRYGALNSSTCNPDTNGGGADDFTYDCTCDGYNYYCPSGYSSGSCDGYSCTRDNPCKTTINTCEFGYTW